MAITKEQLKNNTQEVLGRAFKLADDLVDAAIEAELIERGAFDDNMRPARIVANVVLHYALTQYSVAEADEGAVYIASKKFYDQKIGRKEQKKADKLLSDLRREGL